MAATQAGKASQEQLWAGKRSPPEDVCDARCVVHNRIQVWVGHTAHLVEGHSAP